MSTATTSRTVARRTRAPHIKMTKYEVTVSALLTTAMCAVLTLVVMVCIWLSNLQSTPAKKEVILLPGDGGWEDGDPDATPNVESPEDPIPDPSVENEETDVTELEEVTEQVMEVAETAAELVMPTEFSGQKNSGEPGSADGTGGRPLGTGGGGRGGTKREQRWFVEFADKGDLKSYAAQLDFFGIELGARFDSEGRLVYLSRMSAPTPTTREITFAQGDSEKRLNMTWQDGSEERRAADIDLFKLANIDASMAIIMHFYTPETEQMMAELEAAYAGRKPEEIRRTYFRVRRNGSNYEFYVHSQSLK